MRITKRELSFVVAAAFAARAGAQTFVIQAPGVPAGGQTFLSDQSDFADIDRDGDVDIGIACTGSPDRLWLNAGGAQPGTPGTFSDATAARFPNFTDYARDIDFHDFDGDGDLDAYLARDSSNSSGTSRWWINMGGAQAGVEGFFQDQTAARWVDLNAGSTSIWASLVLANGGFIDWSWDSEFGDLDHDGDLDLFQTALGGGGAGNVPTRVFLNDGAGAFREFNPSGHRLSAAALTTGAPALWCEGTYGPETTMSNGSQADICGQSYESELADFDGDFDLDFVLGGHSQRARYIQSRFADTGGTLAFRDVTSAVFASNYAVHGGYGQGVADLDNDDDLDIYGLNWATSMADHVLNNNGTGTFAVGALLPLSNDDEEDADFFDYDDDGDLDVLLAGYAGAQELYRNELGGAGGFSKQSALIQTDAQVAFDNDLSDADLDGDVDFIVSNEGTPGLHYFRNTSQVGDTRAPRVPRVEQMPDRVASAAPTVVRAYVFDNLSDYVVATYDVELEYSLNGGVFASTPMTWSGAQMFRGAIPGTLIGTIDYRVRATDRSGNAGVSATASFVSGAGNYCTAGTSANGCVGVIAAAGAPSATSGSGFTLSASGIEGAKPALLFYGINGPIAQPWGTSSSFLCVKAPAQRMGVGVASGTPNACDGSLSVDWNAWIAANPTAHGQPFSAGDAVFAQCWYRDPPSAKTTALTDALEFAVGP